jgi:hypothetical protein
MALILVSDVRESSNSNRKARRGLDGQFPRVKSKPRVAGANTGHVMERGTDPPSTCKLAFTPNATSDYLSRGINRLSFGHSPNARVLRASATL